ncbi:hypothetical protein M2271_003578 [Streptomyces sp. LBL]|uniref:phiSA1p31-related protein n=1 Tax=Streptomyces sp. LBL TaxID=2940562 RepID=UPI0024737DA8|nr:phiSA1p31-related protein [Streptomyces sp. LBL]MDH6625767.1 hypothetical protein [Streptomyces sp. LBL]
MAATFKVGDKVEHGSWGAGEIVFGPYTAAFGAERYLMKGENERHYVIGAEGMTPAAKFKVGDKVMGTFSGMEYTIEAGPFFSPNEWYATKSPQGNVTQNRAAVLALVEPEPARDTVENAGKTYELGIFYRDNDGDRWKFERSLTGIRSTSDSFEGGRQLSSVANLYGPLTKI